MRIAVENTTWNNIGDAFYQCSIIEMLRKARPEWTIMDFDGPIQRSFRPGKRTGYAFDSRNFVDAQHYVFSGPILIPSFVSFYGPLIKKIKETGKTYSIISCFTNLSGQQLDEAICFLDKYPPLIIHTRDSESFIKMQKTNTLTVNGICFAYFCSKIRNIPEYRIQKPYLLKSFYMEPDPGLRFSKMSGRLFEDEFNLERRRHGPFFRFTRYLPINASLDDDLSGLDLIRPAHSFNRSALSIFNGPNTYLTYNPLVFLAIYKYCYGTVTDRVHSGVAALSFGNDACVFNNHARFPLFARFGLEQKRHPDSKEFDLIAADKDNVERKYEETCHWLENELCRLIEDNT